MIGELDLTDKIILTTGADGNIATKLQYALANQNATLILACYHLDECNYLAQNISKDLNVTSERLFTEQIDLSS